MRAGKSGIPSEEEEEDEHDRLKKEGRDGEGDKNGARASRDGQTRDYSIIIHCSPAFALVRRQPWVLFSAATTTLDT